MVGDVHGRFDLLKRLIPLIAAHDARRAEEATTRIVFLGDLIDRGPSSAECIASVRQFCAEGQAICLLGNHEDLMLGSIDGDPEAQSVWMKVGGLQTLASYDIAPRTMEEDATDFAERLKEALPEADIAFLRSLPLTYRSGDYLFVHAGVRPGTPLRRQQRGDLIGIRAPFLKAPDWHGAMIVHGHSIVDTVQFRPNRISIDTQAWRSDQLSCLYLEGQVRGVIVSSA